MAYLSGSPLQRVLKAKRAGHGQFTLAKSPKSTKAKKIKRAIVMPVLLAPSGSPASAPSPVADVPVSTGASGGGSGGTALVPSDEVGASAPSIEAEEGPGAGKQLPVVAVLAIGAVLFFMLRKGR